MGGGQLGRQTLGAGGPGREAGREGSVAGWAGPQAGAAECGGSGVGGGAEMGVGEEGRWGPPGYARQERKGSTRAAITVVSSCDGRQQQCWGGGVATAAAGATAGPPARNPQPPHHPQQLWDRGATRRQQQGQQQRHPTRSRAISACFSNSPWSTNLSSLRGRRCMRRAARLPMPGSKKLQGGGRAGAQDRCG